jgi:histidine decarboxylase
MKKRLNKAMAMADYAQQQFRAAGLTARRNTAALTVVFSRPQQWICDKWQLASSGEISHLICMPHVRKEQIDLLLEDIITSQAESAAQPATKTDEDISP